MGLAVGFYTSESDTYSVTPEKHTYHLKYCDPIPVDSLKQPDKHDI